MHDQPVGNMDRVDSVRRMFSDELLQTVDRWAGIRAKPDPRNREKRRGIRIFRNGTVETLFSKAHPIMPIVWAGPLMVFGIYRGLHLDLSSPIGTTGLFFIGVLMWTLLEYILHRYLFHWEATGPRGKLLSFMLHGYHHEFPDDKMRLVAPPLMLWTLGTVVGLGYYLVFGANFWAQILSGTLAGYVAYDWIHYYTHHFHPRRGPGKWLRTYHLRHHFDEGEGRYGISTPLWDLLFRTFRAP